MRYRDKMQRGAGFSLVEVLVALIVISVGLLGIAKMQALALSNTSSARLRSLAAIQAASLAATMHADRAYWANSTAFSPAATATASSGTAASTKDANLQAALTALAGFSPATDFCTQGKAGAQNPCQPVQMAAADLQNWAADLNALIPNSAANIVCDGNPLTCQIQLSWMENLVAFNNKGAAAQQSQAIQSSTYVLFVQP